MAKDKMHLSLVFSADSKAAKNEIEQLQRHLKDLSNTTTMKSKNFQLTSEIREATKAAEQLQTHLKLALNPDTGQLDLSKFDQLLKESGMSLEKYQNQLYMLGPEGEKAFVKLTKSITLAEVPIKQCSKLVSELWTSLKNTAKWQLSSSVIHGFMGALQSAYGYAQDLNKSLNDIQIVTEMSSDQLAQFAKDANKAAQALSTTTNEYAKASLIFYQQGLNSKEVEERTNVTIKMANAAGASATQVSDQLTAVWNNFYDGSKSLEYYADAMTALGAATASSTDEISEGLNKFAAVADTVGLSYEYAAAALATVTATTRQSADVVGTAFKTLFARLQDLELGETLEDGTSLGKYSAALNAVGVNIKDTNGEMKDMDVILNELGAKWKNLSKDTQAAVAQTVAGTRQYTQLIALMDNWEYFQENLSVVNTSEGTLDKQAEIYAESWEAAQKRVQAAAEEIYDQILDDDFFIGLTDMFAGLLKGVSSFIDGLGGVKGVLLTIGTIATRVFSKQIGESISNVAQATQYMTPKSRMKKELQMKKEANNILISGLKDTESPNVQAYELIAQNQTVYARNEERMTAAQKEYNQRLMDKNKLLAESVIEANEALEAAKKELAVQRDIIKTKIAQAAEQSGVSTEDVEKRISELESARKEVEKLTKGFALLENTAAEYSKVNYAKGTQEFKIAKGEIENILKSWAELDQLSAPEDFEKLGQSLGISAEAAKGLVQALSESESVKEMSNVLKGIAEDMAPATQTAEANVEKLNDELKALAGETGDISKDLANYTEAAKKVANASKDASEKTSKLTQEVKEQNKEMYKAPTKPMALGEAFANAASATMAFANAISSVQGLIEVWNSDASTGEKVMTTITTAIGTLIPLVFSLAPAFSTAQVSATLFGAEATKAGVAASAAMWQVTLIVAAITAIVATIVILANQESKAEKETKKLKAAAEEMAKSAEDAKKAVENIGSAFDRYDSAVEKLEQCTKGTDEWRTALQEVNAEVLEILANTPELANIAGLFVRDNETGMLTLDKGKREQILNAANEKAQIQSLQSIIANAKVRIDSGNQFLNSIDTEEVEVGAKVGTKRVRKGRSGSKTVAKLEDEIDLDKILKAHAEELANLDKNAYLNKVKELLSQYANVADKSSEVFQAQITNLAQKAEQYQDEIDNFVSATSQAAEQINNSFLMLADMKLGDSVGASEKQMAANMLEAEQKKLEVALENLMTDNNEVEAAKILANYGFSGATGISQVSGKDNDVYEYIAEKLEKYTDLRGTTGNVVQGNDNNRKMMFVDKNSGESVVKDAKWIAQQIAAGEALEKLGQNADAATKTLANMDKEIAEVTETIGEDAASTSSQQTLVRNWIANKNFENGSREDFNALQTAVDGMGGVEAYVNAIFGGENGILDETEWQTMGFESAEAFYNSFSRSLRDGERMWGSIEIPDTLLHTDKLSATAQDKISKVFKQINAGPMGKAAGEELAAGLNSMLSGLSETEAETALLSLMDVDWSAWDAFEQADAIMRQFGISINSSSKYWTKFTDTMRVATGATPDYSKLISDFNTINAILQDLDFGSIISEDDYNTLIAYNDEWDRFFQIQADGTKKFIGDSATMKKLTQQRLTKDQKSIENEFGDWSKIQQQFGKQAGKTINFSTAAGNISIAKEWTKYKDNAYVRAQMEDALNGAGYTFEDLQAIVSEAEGGNVDRLNALYAKFAEMQGKDYDAMMQQSFEGMASTASTFDELDKLLSDGVIGKEKGTDDELTAYQKQATILAVAGMEAAETLEELKKAKKDGEDRSALKTDTEYAANLERIATNAFGAAKSLDDLNTLKTTYTNEGLNATKQTELYNQALERLAQDAYGSAESINDLKAIEEKYTNAGLDASIRSELYQASLQKLAQTAYGSAKSLDELNSVNNEYAAANLDATEKTKLYNTNLERVAENAYGSVKSLSELTSINTTYSTTTLDATKRTQLFQESLKSLGASYDNAKEELKAYEEALANGTDSAAAQTNLENAITLGEAAKELGIDAMELEELTSNIAENYSLTFENALKYAKGYSILAQELNISTEELMENLSNLTTTFGASMTTEEFDELFKSITNAAKESNLNVNELTSNTIALKKQFSTLENKAVVEMATDFMVASEKYGVSVEELTIQTKTLSTQYTISASAAARLAIQNQRMNNGVATLAQNWEQWKTTLNSTDKTTTEYAKTMTELTSVVKDLVGAGDEFNLTADFVTTNMQLIEKAASGEVKAINQLGVATAKAAVANLQFNESFSQLESADTNNPFAEFTNDFTTNQKIVQSGLEALFTAINDGSVQAGQSIATLGEGWITAFNEMVRQTGMSVEEANSLLNQMGVDAEVNITNVKTTTQTPVYETKEKIIDNGAESGTVIKRTQSSIVGYEPVETLVQVPSINADADIKYIGNGSVSTGSKSAGGGGSAPAKKEKRKSDTRYKQQDDQIDDYDKQIADKERELQTASDAQKASILEDIATLKKSKKEKIDAKKTSAESYLTTDQNALSTAFTNLGLTDVTSLNLDSNNNVTNIEDIIAANDEKYNDYVDAYNRAVDNYAADGSYANKKALEEAENNLNAFEEKMTAFDEAYATFTETRELIEDLDSESKDLGVLITGDIPEKLEQLDDLEERYANITTQIENAEQVTNKANKALDKLYGKDRVNAIKAVNDALEDEIELLSSKVSTATTNLTADQSGLNNALAAITGVEGLGSFQYNTDNKSISNYETIMKKLRDHYNGLISDYNNDVDNYMASEGGITEEEQQLLDNKKKAIEEFQKKMEAVKTASETYNETLGVINDTNEAIADKYAEIQSNNYSMYVENLNNILATGSANMQEYDYYLNKMADDFYNLSESAMYLNSKITQTQSTLGTYETHWNSLVTAKANNAITDADYYAGLIQVRDGIYSELEALQSLDDEMINYYENTLSQAGEEINKYTGKIEKMSSTLDHYQSLLTLMGKEKDLTKMNAILTGIADIAEDSKKIAEEEYEFYKQQANKKKELMDAATQNSPEWEMLKKEWEAAEAAMSESQDRMLTATQKWAESMKAVTENQLQEYAKTLEQALSGSEYGSFNEMTTAMERAVSLQEEYLTSTNQIYETSKMMRTAQKAIDETTNQVAKNKLKAFMEETEQLQSQTRLSKYELELHQADYDLLLAEIALEEAQSAKSTVRLQRDSEGNFGYVYTADANKIADAEQKVADAQNALYNKQLEGANDYTQKYQQTLSEMYDTMQSLQEQYLSGEIATQDEYNTKMTEAQQHYYQKLTDFSELYQVATVGNSDVIADAWSSDFADMTTQTAVWQEAVTAYANNCANAFIEWQSVISEVESVTGADLASLSTKVTDITDASEELAETLTKDDGIIDKLEGELTAVSNVTEAYAEQRDTIKDLIEEYEEYINSLNTTINGKNVTTTITTTTVPTDGAASMDTGGYTGEWGPEGKLAVLHEKEIVLNAQDTENLLAAVGTLRIILNAIDTHSMSAQIGGMLSTPGFVGGNHETIEQNVRIEASFPAVQDRNEIEEAFNNLVNRASQYANRK